MSKKHCYTVENTYAQNLILVNFLLVKTFSCFVITQSHELGFGRNLVQIVPTSLPQLSKQLRTLNNSQNPEQNIKLKKTIDTSNHTLKI